MDGSRANNDGGLVDDEGKGQAHMDNTTKGKIQPDTIGEGKAQM